MSDTTAATEQREKKRSLFNRFLDIVEVVGNKFPDPVLLFALLCVIILIASAIAGAVEWQAVHPGTGETIVAQNLLNIEGLRRIIGEATANFGAFPALGLVLVVMLGIGLSERSGYFETVMHTSMVRAPRKLIIPAIAFIGILGNAAGDAAPIVLPPLSAMIFLQLGWHPLAGIALAYASALGGFAANLMLGMSDALVFAFTQPAAELADATVELNTAMNWYFIAASVLILVPTVWFVTAKIAIPRLGTYVPQGDIEVRTEDATPQELKAMRAANWSVVVFIILLVVACIPENSFLRNGETGSLINASPLMQGIAILLAVFFFIPGFIYGVKAGTIKNTRDIGSMMAQSMGSMGSFIVIVFFAAQMLAYFSWSNLGTIIAVKGAEALEGQNGVVIILGIIVLSSLINLLIGSASAKWAILAPILVPMMMFLGFHPAFTQMIYRIGDSITNPISLMLPYFAIVLAFAQKYDKKLGIGTLLATMLPYSIVMGIVWTLFLVVWFLLGIPVGPGGPIYL